MNEMLMANHLLKNSEDPKFKRWVIVRLFHAPITTTLSRTYWKQRTSVRVYKHVDNYETVTAELLNEINAGLLKNSGATMLRLPKALS